jgi:hypothetical protein
VQVRNILNTGLLSFSDAPLYFYFCAFIVKVISVLGFTVTNEIIISVIKIVDSTALPLLAIPLFIMVSRKDRNIPFFAGLAILLFAVLSFTPFLILGVFAFCMVLLIFIFAFPLYDLQYFQRFAVLLFIPQSLLILYLIRMNPKSAVPFSILLILLTTLSIFISFSEENRPCIDNPAFQDLQNINKYITEDKENTIIIATHGLEFWSAWALNVSVGQDRSMDKIGLDKYRNIIFPDLQLFLF